ADAETAPRKDRTRPCDRAPAGRPGAWPLPGRFRHPARQPDLRRAAGGDHAARVERRIVILDIDEQSLGELGHWPWSRHLMAELIDKLFVRYGVALVDF